MTALTELAEQYNSRIDEARAHTDLMADSLREAGEEDLGLYERAVRRSCIHEIVKRRLAHLRDSDATDDLISYQIAGDLLLSGLIVDRVDG